MRGSMLRVVLLAAAELATYGSGRPRACTRRPSALRSRACAAWPPQCSPRATPGPLRSTATLADLTAFDHPGNAVSFEPTARNWVNLARLHAAKGQSALANDAMGKAKSLGGI